ncbi:MAG: hypothetical protein RJA24_1042 [Pseudomonadota bacterium]
MQRTENLAVNQIKRALFGNQGPAGIMMFINAMIMRIKLLVQRSSRFMGMSTGMAQGMSQRPLLCSQQQRHKRPPQCGAAQNHGKHRKTGHCLSEVAQLLRGSNGNGIGQTVIQAHRIIAQHRKPPRHNNRLKTVFHRRFGLHLNHLLRTTGQAE